ncbi:hypothetical protein Pla123a_10350 [Posidoniimonas polymericola]|uniref:DUF2062 domain-containing protein n=1 Tax=Posidoniimonas polymericola TaxID=2528002 RepID=A0A5C5YTB9_9BACT|nr:TIGR03546 family protein [Posidoniimonas polymericola]TWT78244.1 hypothetical protein Pla123a_10350 [Posidoniimonas polymericola]
MLSMLLRPLRQSVGVLLANDSPRQVAAGVAIGVMLGLVPKGNLLAVSLGVLLLSLRVNKPAGLAAATLFSWIGLAGDPFFHRLGGQLLKIDSLQPTLVWLYEQPLGPWIGFNNTVVLGSFITGLYAAYPCYLLSHMIAEKVQPPVAKWLMRYKVARALMGLDLTSRLNAAGIGGGS